MYATRYSLALTVDADGNAIVYTDGPAVNGRVLQVRYIPDPTNPLATGADLTITGEDSGQPILALENIGTVAFGKCPRQETHGPDGVSLRYAASGAFVEDYVYLANERIKVVVAQGGASKTGRLLITVG